MRAEIERIRRVTRTQGFAALRDSVNPELLRKLQVEARRNQLRADRTEQSTGVRYQAAIAPLGRRARTLLGGAAVSRLLLRTFGRSYRLVESRSCLTCYGEKDYLGPHLDEPGSECVVTLIIYVSVEGAHRRSSPTGLELRVYGRTMSRDQRPRLVLPTRTGDVVIGHGSRFWHERPMLAKGEHLLALTACYQPRSATL